MNKQIESDLLVAVNKDGLSYNVDEQQTVPLTFTHVMAKLVVNLTYKNQWGCLLYTSKSNWGGAPSRKNWSGVRIDVLRKNRGIDPKNEGKPNNQRRDNRNQGNHPKGCLLYTSHSMWTSK